MNEPSLCGIMRPPPSWCPRHADLHGGAIDLDFDPIDGGFQPCKLLAGDDKISPASSFAREIAPIRQR